MRHESYWIFIADTLMGNNIVANNKTMYANDLFISEKFCDVTHFFTARADGILTAIAHTDN